MRAFLLVLLSILAPLALASCVTPNLALSTDPPGICVQIPVVPIDACVQIRPTSLLQQRKMALAAKRGEAPPPAPGTTPGLRRALGLGPTKN